MNKTSLTYWFFSILIIAISSCSQEEIANDDPKVPDNRIYFRSYLPKVSATTRSQILTEIDSCIVSCFSINDNEVIPYFREATFIKGKEEKFTSDDPLCVWGEDELQQMNFYAFSPSLPHMQQIIDSDKNDTPTENAPTVRNGEVDGEEVTDDNEDMTDNGEVADGNEGKRYFEVEASEETTDADNFMYNIKNFRISNDLSKQVDFVTAYSVGSKDDSEEGVSLNFQHQLAALQLEAWGAHDKYDFEIAGACVGNAVVEATFKFSPSPQATGPTSVGWWDLGETPVKERVEYIFRPGDAVVTISKASGLHSDKEDATSILDKSGVAMVIPTNGRMEPWEGKADPNIGLHPYSTDKIYFSILLRVAESTKGETVYPFPNDKENMTKIYFAVDKDNKILSQVYSDAKSGNYYRDKEYTQEYLPNEEETVKEFGWAAVPVVANWQAGKTYKYTLDYSQGIGWQDPRDPNPGNPILNKVMIDVSDEELPDWGKTNDHIVIGFEEEDLTQTSQP